MAYFAKLNSSNIVIEVIAVNNNELINEDGNESETKGIEFLKSLYGQDTKWIQTSYNTRSGVHIKNGTPFRKNFAGVGYIYDENRDAFIQEKPFNSWILNENTCKFDPPVPMPETPWPVDTYYTWDEDSISWKENKI
jgi:hypothetical protein